jgi:uncharacterized membrane-anchored protein
MYTSFKNSLHGALVGHTTLFWLVPICTIFLAQHCNADQPSLLSLTSPNKTQIEWTSGPADASLGTLADIKIPKGYRFADAAVASSLLGRMNNPVPQGLVGILAPESGQWWVVLNYSDIGYVKDADKDRIDAKAILKTISDRADGQNEERTIHGLPLITSVNWELSPVFDVNTHTVEWAVLAKTQSAEVINHTVRLLGRQGVLDATVVEPYQADSGLAPLKDLMKNISFKNGQRYVDYQKGDKVSDINLAGLITGEDDSLAAQKNDVATPTKSAGAWGWYVFAGVLAGAGVLLFRGVVHPRRKARHVLSASSAVTNGNADGTAHPVATAVVIRTNGSEPDNMKPKVAIAKNGSSNHRASRRRRKIFDYYRFYTDTVMKLSSTGYTPEVSKSNGHTNGHSNSHSNGHSVGRVVEGQPPSYEAMNQAIVQAHLDLIANQKELIEEQKRLMVEQARLIEEKSKLIKEHNHLLERQSEVIESQFSLKLG